MMLEMSHSETTMGISDVLLEKREVTRLKPRQSLFVQAKDGARVDFGYVDEPAAVVLRVGGERVVEGRMASVSWNERDWERPFGWGWQNGAPIRLSEFDPLGDRARGASPTDL